MGIKEYKEFCIKNNLKPSRFENLEIFYILNYKRGNKND